MRRFQLGDEAATITLGTALALLARPSAVFALSGPLGAGKTCLARGIITGLDPRVTGKIVSPTFTLVQTYPTVAGMVWHFDLYRLKHADEVIELGFDEALGGDISIVEWAEHLGKGLPANRVDVTLAQAGLGRQATVIGRGAYSAMVATWRPGLLEEGGAT